MHEVRQAVVFGGRPVLRQAVKPLGPTAGYGKPYVRWCGRVPGRNPRHPTRSIRLPLEKMWKLKMSPRMATWHAKMRAPRRVRAAIGMKAGSATRACLLLPWLSSSTLFPTLFLPRFSSVLSSALAFFYREGPLAPIASTTASSPNGSHKEEPCKRSFRGEKTGTIRSRQSQHPSGVWRSEQSRFFT